MGGVFEVFRVALRLGLTSFGGPVAHIGYFQEEYVRRRRWVDEATFADLVALAQFLPGAASSKLGMSIGMIRAGLPGAVAAWLGFTLPSAVLIVGFAYGARHLGLAAWLDGLRIAAVAVVALAVWQMWIRLAPDRLRSGLVVLAAVAQLLLPGRFATVAIVAAAGLAGYLLLRRAEPDPPEAHPRLVAAGRRTALVAAGVLVGLLVTLPLLRYASGVSTVAVVDAFYRTGALVFGGGNVVLPLLDAEVAGPGWVSQGQLLAGYGAAQAVPGPLFTVAGYLGVVMTAGPGGVAGAAITLLAIFLPSFLLVVATLPWLSAIRRYRPVRAVLSGVNAAVVGVLLAALYDPLWLTAVGGPEQLALALAAFGLLAFARLPPWAVVLLTAAGGAGLAAITG